jgi:thioredoxin 1
MYTTELTRENFEKTVDTGIVFADGWTIWCGPCRAFAPIHDRRTAKHPNITWGKIDTDAEQQLAGGLGIRSIPTLMVFRDGIVIFEQPEMMSATVLNGLVEKVRARDMNEVRTKIAASEADAAVGAG